MSERPFMQLYVSDFIGDTLHLSTEQIGAYMLLLMAMWNAGGRLPSDDAKLARVVRMSIKKWRSISGDLLSFFDRDESAIWHNRLTKELEKSESKSNSRADSGAAGGRAKALKDKAARVANATPLPQHLPDTISPSSLRSDGEARDRKSNPAITLQSVLSPIAAQRWVAHCTDRGRKPSEPQAEELAAVLREIRSLGGNPDEAIKLAIRRGWVSIEIEYLRNNGFPFKTSAPPASVDWPGAVALFRENGTWIHAWGPAPGEKGCRVPPELLREHAA